MNSAVTAKPSALLCAGTENQKSHLQRVNFRRNLHHHFSKGGCKWCKVPENRWQVGGIANKLPMTTTATSSHGVELKPKLTVNTATNSMRVNVSFLKAKSRAMNMTQEQLQLLPSFRQRFVVFHYAGPLLHAWSKKLHKLNTSAYVRQKPEGTPPISVPSFRSILQQKNWELVWEFMHKLT